VDVSIQRQNSTVREYQHSSGGYFYIISKNNNTIIYTTNFFYFVNRVNLKLVTIKPQ